MFVHSSFCFKRESLVFFTRRSKQRKEEKKTIFFVLNRQYLFSPFPHFLLRYFFNLGVASRCVVLLSDIFGSIECRTFLHRSSVVHFWVDRVSNIFASIECRTFLRHSPVRHFCVDRVSNIFASIECRTFLRQSLTADLSSLTMRNKLVC